MNSTAVSDLLPFRLIKPFLLQLLFYRDFKPRDPDVSEGGEAPLSNFQGDKLPDKKEALLKKLKVGTARQVEWLWDFCCDLTEGRNISCLAWNKVCYWQFMKNCLRNGMANF